MTDTDERKPIELGEVVAAAQALAAERDGYAAAERFLATLQSWAAPTLVACVEKDAASASGWRLLPPLTSAPVPPGFERSLDKLLADNPGARTQPSLVRGEEMAASNVKVRDNWIIPWTRGSSQGLLLLRGVPRPYPSNLGEAVAVLSQALWPLVASDTPAVRLARLNQAADDLRRFGDQLLAEVKTAQERLASQKPLVDVAALEAAQVEAEAERDRARVEGDRARAEVESLSAKLKALEPEIENQKWQSAALQQELEAARSERETIRTELEAARTEIEVARTELEAARTKLAEAASERDGVRTEAQSLKARMPPLETELADGRSKLAALERELDGLQQDLAGLKRELGYTQTQRDQAKAEAAALQERLAALEGQAAEAADLKQQVSLLEQARGERDGARAELEQARAEQEKTRGAAETEKSGLKEEVEQLLRMAESLQRAKSALVEEKKAAEQGEANARSAREAAERERDRLRADFGETTERVRRAEEQARALGDRWKTAVGSFREALETLSRTPFVPPALRIAVGPLEGLPELATSHAKSGRPRILFLDRDLPGLDTIAGELETAGLEVLIAHYAEEVAFFLKTPDSQGLTAIVCDVMAFRSDQDVAELVRSWKQSAPAAGFFLSFKADNPTESQRAQRVPAALTSGHLPRPLHCDAILDRIAAIGKRQPNKS